MGSGRPRRGIRSLVVAILFLAGLAFVADRVAESLAEERLVAIAEEEAARYDVRAAGISTEVGGFGFLPQLVKGEFSRVTLTMERPTISAIPAEDLTVVMTDIQVPRELLTGNTAVDVHVDHADLRLRLSPDALGKLAARTSGLDGLTLRIVDGKLQVRVEVQGVDAVATVLPRTQNGRLRLVVDDESTQLPPAIREAVNSLLARGVEVPELPFGAKLQQTVIERQSVLLTATAGNLDLSAS